MIYELLKKYAHPRNYIRTDEYLYYIDHSLKYAEYLKFYKISPTESHPFTIIQANVILRSIENKLLFEKVIEETLNSEEIKEVEDKAKFVKDQLWKTLDEEEVSYFIDEEARVYMPTFSRSLNVIYNDEPSKIMSAPYDVLVKKPETSLIDLFDTYGYKLYNSAFSPLILIKEDKTSAAFYHSDLETIYIINDQGRLDAEIVLFDKYMGKNIDKHHLLGKIEDSVNKFYENNKKEFLSSLYHNNLISRKLYKRIQRKMANIDRKRLRR